MNIYVYDRDHRLVSSYVGVGPGKLMDIANELLCFSSSIHDFTYECVKGFLRVEMDERLI